MTTESQTNTEAQEHVHEITIIVNAQQKTVTTKELTFDEVVRLAYPTPPTGPTVEISVTYYRGEGEKPEGTLEEGQSVKVKEGMVFNVRVTDKS
jgi:Multiubiquitin